MIGLYDRAESAAGERPMISYATKLRKQLDCWADAMANGLVSVQLDLPSLDHMANDAETIEDHLKERPVAIRRVRKLFMASSALTLVNVAILVVLLLR